MQIYEHFCYHANPKLKKMLTLLQVSHLGKTAVNVICTFNLSPQKKPSSLMKALKIYSAKLDQIVLLLILLLQILRQSHFQNRYHYVPALLHLHLLPVAAGHLPAEKIYTSPPTRLSMLH